MEDFDKYKELLKGNEPGECQACGGPLTLEKVNLEDYQGGKLFMMEGVPAYVCQVCGEVWVPEPIMIEFEKMIQTVKQSKKKKKPPRLPLDKLGVARGKTKKRKGGKKK